MPGNMHSHFTLDDTSVRFIVGGVSINVAARDANKNPFATRAYGCRISSDRSQVSIILFRDISREVIQLIEANKQIAVVFSRPTTHETLQLKGVDAVLGPCHPDDRLLHKRYVDLVAADLISAGYSPAFAHSMMPTPSLDMLAVTFTPTQAFNQTPGPKAGTPLVQ
jgi:hypothetical protein